MEWIHKKSPHYFSRAVVSQMLSNKHGEKKRYDTA